MELDVHMIKSVLTLYDEMQKSSIDLVYFGEFSHDITKMFGSMAEGKMEMYEEERSTKRKVYHVLVETLQNLNKHSDWISDKRNIGSGLFIIGKKNDVYYIITSNKVSKEKKLVLDEQMKVIAEATHDDLKDMYKRQLKDGKLSEKGGAGLGLIDIARKADGLQHHFLPLDADGFLFILKAEIDASKTHPDE